MTDLYQDLVLLARPYKSFAAELYIARLMKTCGTTREGLTFKHLPGLCHAARAEWRYPEDPAKLNHFLAQVHALSFSLRDGVPVPSDAEAQ